MHPEVSAILKVGVLLYDTDVEIDVVLQRSVRHLQALGVSVGGLLQRFGERLANGKRSMWLDDIGTGQTIRLDRPRGPVAISCILDPDALAQGACLLRQAVDSEVDLIVVNRFGVAEADGGGMRAEIADAICSGAAVLIPVKYSLMGDLEGFLGGSPLVLLPSVFAIADWAEQAGAFSRNIAVR